MADALHVAGVIIIWAALGVLAIGLSLAFSAVALGTIDWLCARRGVR